MCVNFNVNYFLYGPSLTNVATWATVLTNLTLTICTVCTSTCILLKTEIIPEYSSGIFLRRLYLL